MTLVIVSAALLVPGLLLDMMTLNISISVPLFGNQTLHDETRSILGTIGTLFENGNPTVAILILLFSVVVPFLKLMGMVMVVGFPGHPKSKAVHAFLGHISKWAMADVFVVGVFIAFLTTTTDANIKATLHEGFYFFVAYCLVSGLSVQLVRNSIPDQVTA